MILTEPLNEQEVEALHTAFHDLQSRLRAAEDALRQAERDSWEFSTECARLREALETVRQQGGTCPCGAWFLQEAERPHVIGCKVGQALGRDQR